MMKLNQKANRTSFVGPVAWTLWSRNMKQRVKALMAIAAIAMTSCFGETQHMNGGEEPELIKSENRDTVEYPTKSAKLLLIDGKWQSRHIGGGDTMIVENGVVYYTQRWDSPPQDEFPVIKIVPRFENNVAHLDFEKFTYTLVPISVDGEIRFVVNPSDPKNIPKHRFESAFRYMGK